MGELGDRSSIMTFALSARYDSFLIFCGCSTGLAFSNFLAVMGGKILASKVSERFLNYVGGLLMILFAGLTFIWYIYILYSNYYFYYHYIIINLHSYL